MEIKKNIYLVLFFLLFLIIINCPNPNNNNNQQSEYFFSAKINNNKYDNYSMIHVLYDKSSDMTYINIANSLDDLFNNHNCWSVQFPKKQAGSFNDNSIDIVYDVDSFMSGEYYSTSNNCVLNITNYTDSFIEGNFNGKINHYPDHFSGSNYSCDLSGSFKIEIDPANYY